MDVRLQRLKSYFKIHRSEVLAHSCAPGRVNMWLKCKTKGCGYLYKVPAPEARANIVNGEQEIMLLEHALKHPENT